MFRDLVILSSVSDEFAVATDTKPEMRFERFQEFADIGVRWRPGKYM